MSVPSLESLLEFNGGPEGLRSFIEAALSWLYADEHGNELGVTAAERHLDGLLAAALLGQRTITTVEQLNCLPIRAIVRDANGFVFEYAPTGEGGNTWWYDGGPHDPDEVDLPALVIWCPADEAEVQP